MGKESQRAKILLKAVPNELTAPTNDYYLILKNQKQLTMTDLAREVAATHGHQNASEVEMLAREVLELANWYLSNGYTVTTPMGSYRTTVKGVLLDTEVSESPNRDRLTLDIGYTPSEQLRQLLDGAELDVEINKAAIGPQLNTVVSAYDAQNPDAVTRGDSMPVEAGQACVIKGRNLKVGGTADDAGVTLTRVDGTSGETYFIPVRRLSPNTPTQVGFVMPATAPDKSVWKVSIRTYLGNNGSYLLKSPRTVELAGTFTVGEAEIVTPPPTGGGDDEGGSMGGDGGSTGGGGDEGSMD